MTKTYSDQRRHRRRIAGTAKGLEEHIKREKRKRSSKGVRILKRTKVLKILKELGLVNEF